MTCTNRPQRSDFRIEREGPGPYFYVVKGAARWGPFRFYATASTKIDELCREW